MPEELRYSQKDFDKLIENIGNKPQSAEVTQQKTEYQQYKDLQLQHLTLKESLDPKNKYSLSCITIDERNEFALALAINDSIFGEPMITKYIDVFFETSKSVTTNNERVPFYQGIFDMAKNQILAPIEQGSRGIVSKILGR